MASGGMLHSHLENWLWEAACRIRRDVDAPKYKITSLIFLKSLSDVFEDERTNLANEYGSTDTVEELLEVDHSVVRFYLPEQARWTAVAKKRST